MPGKASYSELDERLKELEKETMERNRLEALLDETKAKLEEAGEKILKEIVIREGAEEKILQQIQRLESLIEFSTFAVVTLDENHHVVSCNSQFEDLFHYRVSELLGRDINRMIGEKGPPDEALSYAEKVLAGEPVHGNGRRYRKDGEPVDVEFFGVPTVVNGKVEGTFWIYRNVSELRLITNDLRESEKKYRKLYEESKKSEELYRSLLSSSADAIVIYDPEGKARYVSPAFTRLFGWTMDEVMGNRIPYLPEPEREDALDRIFDVMESGVPCKDFETKRVTKDGRSLDVSISASRYDDHTGRPAGLLVILRDISERKSLEAQLYQAHKMEAVGTLAGGIAHDFNNILQAITGYSQMLIIGKDRDDPDYKKIEAIEKSARKAADLTRQLLIFSRKTESELRPVDINSEVKQVVALLERTLPKMIQMELLLAENLHVINGDPVQIEQIVMNLSVNAMDALQDGGRLTFKTENVRLDAAFCRNHLGAEPGDYVALTVSDTGEGIRDDVLDHIFEPFFTTKETGKGTGLGLAMVYGIVKNHGGYITCSSEVGKGTTFEIYFPILKKTSIARPEEEQKPDIVPGKGERILLVDDEENIRQIIRDMLSRFGYQVLTAKSGEEAIEIFESQGDTIDLIILDLNMPGMGGQKCLELLLRKDPKARVIIASGYSVNKKAKEALKSGALGFISKPYHYTDILKRLREVLDA